MSQQIVLGTSNKGKLREFEALLSGALPAGWTIVGPQTLPAPLPEVDEDQDSFHGNAAKKALAFSLHVGGAVLAEDSGLVVDALGGEPGVHSARWAGAHGDDAANNRKLVERMDALGSDVSRSARYVATICLAFLDDALGAQVLGAVGATWDALPEGVPEQPATAGRVGDRGLIWVRGELLGQITRTARGEGGFGYDPHFELPALGLTAAQLSLAQKNAISHRARALAELAALLNRSA